MEPNVRVPLICLLNELPKAPWRVQDGGHRTRRDENWVLAELPRRREGEELIEIKNLNAVLAQLLYSSV
jgi:hypothetical protein